MQDEKKSHGKAGAYRGFLTKYCAKRAFLKQFLSYGTSPLRLPFYYLCVESSSLSPAKALPLFASKRLSSCSMVRFFFSSPETSTTI